MRTFLRSFIFYISPNKKDEIVNSVKFLTLVFSPWDSFPPTKEHTFYFSKLIKMFPKCSKIIQKCSQISPKMSQNCSKNYTKILWNALHCIGLYIILWPQMNKEKHTLYKKPLFHQSEKSFGVKSVKPWTFLLVFNTILVFLQ